MACERAVLELLTPRISPPRYERANLLGYDWKRKIYTNKHEFNLYQEWLAAKGYPPVCRARIYERVLRCQEIDDFFGGQIRRPDPQRPVLMRGSLVVMASRRNSTTKDRPRSICANQLCAEIAERWMRRYRRSIWTHDEADWLVRWLSSRFEDKPRLLLSPSYELGMVLSVRLFGTRRTTRHNTKKKWAWLKGERTPWERPRIAMARKMQKVADKLEWAERAEERSSVQELA